MGYKKVIFAASLVLAVIILTGCKGGNQQNVSGYLDSSIWPIVTGKQQVS